MLKQQLRQLPKPNGKEIIVPDSEEIDCNEVYLDPEVATDRNSIHIFD